MFADLSSFKTGLLDTLTEHNNQEGTRSRLIGRGKYGSGQPAGQIIRGDNVSVLQCLRETLLGKVRCVYIDPPYNNAERYTHYTDDQSAEDWLRPIIRCVALLRDLLAQNGSIWISIDDKQVHYLKVALDQIFGARNFVTTIIWQQRSSRENRKVFSNNHEYILVYAKDLATFKATRNMLAWNDEVRSRFKNPDNDPRGPWQSVSANVQDGHATPAQFYTVNAPSGKSHRPPKGRCWVYNKTRMTREIKQGNVWFGRDGKGVPRLKRFLTDAKQGFTPHTLWLADEVGTNDTAKKHLLALFRDKALFDTPKPEQLVRRILEIGSDPGDLVLDAYLGSGTTSAVAHKLRRKYVGIEVGGHAVTHAVARMRQVVDGESGGISGDVDWKGGGSVAWFEAKSTRR